MEPVRLGARIYRYRARAPRLSLLVKPKDEPARNQPQWRILVVDDDVDAASSLALILELGGHDVRTTFDGASALEMANEFQPELAILDIAMPEMNGYEVCRRLRAMPRGRRMVIIALTGLAQKMDRLRSRMAGFDTHLLKPAEPDEISRIVSHLMPQPY